MIVRNSFMPPDVAWKDLHLPFAAIPSHIRGRETMRRK
jgi:hypothetical protein